MSSPDAGKTANTPAARLDLKAVRRAFDRAATTGGDERAVAAEIALRMAARLDYVRLQPLLILDAGCGAAPAARLLAKRFPTATITGVDASLSMLNASRRGEPLLTLVKRTLGYGANLNVCGQFDRLPFADASIDMVWSNLALAWEQDAAPAFREFHRVLKEGGLLMFSTYGPDTLCELRAAFAAVDKQPHVHEFTDMHDLGDLLLASGFAEPVMDMEKLAYTYADVEPMVRELRRSGQTNAMPDRRRGLMSRSRWNAMLAAYARRAQDARIQATFEIVYGHAWKGKPRASASSRGAATIQWSPSRKQ